jgi:hypothetical protein
MKTCDEKFEQGDTILITGYDCCKSHEALNNTCAVVLKTEDQFIEIRPLYSNEVREVTCSHATLVSKAKKPVEAQPQPIRIVETVVVATVCHPGSRAFLFEVPEGAKVECLDEVLCDTMRGDAPGVVHQVIEVTKDTLPALVAAMGAFLPLKKLIGKYTRSLTKF